ncbi:hypothetical protein Sa4125_33240 [Aureimonas sp. SA4125]|uniref:DUF1499 domain-containing protein n=1 Tax=Aureimonas sp. SA4125 TaxID=2826993 RepID=UPI001CC3ACD0|nr:DUF1499 domain-containing protein [Aureimonas sp. SA4125]BDA85782.1 hypothetical protein Sa4125_33240 [Aureimonas sp. SA4125]
MTTSRRIVLALCGLLGLGGVWFLAVGSEQVWTWYAGSADQDGVDNLGTERRRTPTDSLACSPATCSARVDIALPDYREPPAVLMQRLDRIVLADRRNLLRVDDRSRPDYRRYVARTPVLRFPDTIESLAAPRGSGSALVIYGRSLVGENDWGVNHARLALWAAELEDAKVGETAPSL